MRTHQHARPASTYRGARRNAARADRIILRSPSRHVSSARLGNAPKFYEPHQGARERGRRRLQIVSGKLTGLFA